MAISQETRKGSMKLDITRTSKRAWEVRKAMEQSRKGRHRSRKGHTMEREQGDKRKPRVGEPLTEIKRS